MTYIIQRDSSRNQEESTGTDPLNFLLDSIATFDTLRDPYMKGYESPYTTRHFQMDQCHPFYGPLRPDSHLGR